jgi:plastocyanin
MIGTFGAAQLAWGTDLEVAVLDNNGAPVSHVVVYALPDRPALGGGHKRSKTTATMGQRDTAFDPHILVVETGTLIGFPNSDRVSHHVYSFSPAKNFQLPLYKGNIYEPLAFDEPGIVTLGCNIHDDMLGYIVVLDTPYFALTDEHGMATIDAIPAGSYTVQSWTARLPAARLPPAQPVKIDTRPVRLTIQFASKLFPAHAHEGSSLTWRDY